MKFMKEDNTETLMSGAGQRGQKQWAPAPARHRERQPGSQAAGQVLFAG